MTNSNIITLCVFLLINSFGFAQTEHHLDIDGKKKDIMTKSFKVWDSNKDGKIDMKEFKVSFNKTNAYKDWDTNTDNLIDEKEWHKGVSLNYENSDLKYIDWDINGDKLVDHMEFTTGNFNAWDNNSDQFINPSEFAHWQKKDIE